MPDELRLELYDKTMEYAFEAETSEMSVIADGIIGLIKPILDKDRARYESICERNKINGSKGGRKTQNKPKQNPENPVGSLGSVWETQEEPKDNPKEPKDNPKEPLNDIMINDKLNNNLESKDSSSVTTETDKPKEKPINYMEIVNFYNKSMEGKKIAKMRGLSDQRKSAIHARIVKWGIEAVYEVITKSANSDFMNGNNDRNWSADASWIFGPENFEKILEGRYDNARLMRYGTDITRNYGGRPTHSELAREAQTRCLSEMPLPDVKEDNGGSGAIQESLPFD